MPGPVDVVVTRECSIKETHSKQGGGTNSIPVDEPETVSQTHAPPSTDSQPSKSNGLPSITALQQSVYDEIDRQLENEMKWLQDLPPVSTVALAAESSVDAEQLVQALVLSGEEDNETVAEDSGNESDDDSSAAELVSGDVYSAEATEKLLLKTPASTSFLTAKRRSSRSSSVSSNASSVQEPLEPGHVNKRSRHSQPPSPPTSFIDEIMNSIMNPGFSSRMVLYMNVTFIALFFCLFSLIVLSGGNLHAILLFFISVLLFSSIHWQVKMKRIMLGFYMKYPRNLKAIKLKQATR